MYKIQPTMPLLCDYNAGRATEWFNTAKEIPKIITRIKDVIQKLINSVIHRRSLADDMENTFNNGVQTMVSHDDANNFIYDMNYCREVENQIVLIPAFLLDI